MSLQNLVRLSQIKKKSLSDYAHVNKVPKKIRKKYQFVSYNMMIGYDIYDRFTVEHFPLRQSMILTTSFFFARDSTMAAKKLWTPLSVISKKKKKCNPYFIVIIITVLIMIGFFGW
jgi:hypothetical protein